MKILDSFVRIGEQDIFIRARQMVKRSEVAIGMLDRVINESGGINGIAELKANSYLDMLDISKSITSGAIAPNLITDMLTLISLENNMVDTIFNVARSFDRFTIPETAARRFFKERILQASTLMHSSLDLLYKLHTISNVQKMRKYQQEISRMEEEGDEIKESMLSYAYNSRIAFKSFYHITNLAYLSDNVIDMCEDIADMYVSIMLSIAT